MPSAGQIETTWKKVQTVGSTVVAPRRYHTGVYHDNKLWIFGGFKGKDVYVNELFYLDLCTQEWHQVQQQPINPVDTSQWPKARACHSADVVGDKMFIFGGLAEDGSTPLGDLWTFDLKSLKWTQLSTGTDGPEPRYHHSQVYLPHRNSLLVSGGSITLKTYRTDLWEYLLAGGRWRELKTSNPNINKRSGHLLMFDNSTQTLIQYGGFAGDGGFEYLNDQYETKITSDLDVDDEIQWTAAEVIGTAPVTARPLSAVLYSGNHFVFGGYDGKSPSGDFLMFQWATRRWISIALWMEMDMASIANGTSAPNARATPRYGHVTVLKDVQVVNEDEGIVPTILVHGGTGSMYLGDVIQIDIPLN